MNPSFTRISAAASVSTRVGQQVARVGMNLELDPFRQAGARGEAREAHGFLGVRRAAGVRQQQKSFRIDEFEDVRERIAFAGHIRAAQSHGDDFRAAGDQRIAHQFVRREFSRAHQQARGELAIGDLQFGRLVRHW